MKVLVTGACGYVGSALVPFLLAQGHRVVGYDCQWFGDGVLPKSNAHLKIINGDLRDANAAAAAMLGCDAVIHLAGLTSDRGCQLEPELADECNVEAFKGLVESVKNVGVERLIFLSSAAAYGSTDRPATEEMKLNPTTRYGLAKVYCEQILRKSPRVPWIILRPAGVCGYSPRMRFDLTVNRMVRDAYCLKKISVHGGEQVRPNLHIRDLMAALGMLLTAHRSRVLGQTFNLACGNETVREVAEIVSRTVGAEISTSERADDRSYSIDSSRIKRVLGFIPRFTIESAAYDLLCRFKAGYWADAMTNTNYLNVRGAALENESSPG